METNRNKSTTINVYYRQVKQNTDNTANVIQPAEPLSHPDQIRKTLPGCHQHRADQQYEERASVVELERQIVDGDFVRAELHVRRNGRKCAQHGGGDARWRLDQLESPLCRCAIAVVVIVVAGRRRRRLARTPARTDKVRGAGHRRQPTLSTQNTLTLAHTHTRLKLHGHNELRCGPASQLVHRRKLN